MLPDWLNLPIAATIMPVCNLIWCKSTYGMRMLFHLLNQSCEPILRQLSNIARYRDDKFPTRALKRPFEQLVTRFQFTRAIGLNEEKKFIRFPGFCNLWDKIQHEVCVARLPLK